MKPLEQLINHDEPGILLVRQWAESASNALEFLPPSAEAADVLLRVQVTTRSPMGAVAYETGGILVDHGWLRFLGSGHTKLTRTLSDWNENRANGFYLVADDMAGGFFAIDGGAFSDGTGEVYYLAPDNLEWEGLEIGYSELLRWAFAGDLEGFYQDLRWSTWRHDTASLSGDQCFSFYPFLWTKQGSTENSHRGIVPVASEFQLRLDIISQLSR
ncbi:MAG: DUF2625 domain-containing protein [Planctomycetaceae bacterium]